MTVAETLAKAEQFLASKRVSEAGANAEFILAHVLGCRRPELRVRGERPLTPQEERHAWHLLHERGGRQPLAYVLGTQEFMGLELEVNPSVLIPRPETEELVQAVVLLASRIPRGASALQVLDIGTGSGCVSVALAHLLPEAQIVATDISAGALALAEKNARRHQLGRRIRFLQADLFSAAGGARRAWADIAVSNPPYIPSAEVARLEPEVLREPRLALDGGKDGLEAIRAIVAEAPVDLKAGGFLALEIGHDQGPAVRRLLEKAGFKDIELRKDAQGIERIVLARR